MASSLNTINRSVLIYKICFYLDQVSFFRLARVSKTMYEMLKEYLPKEDVLKYFNWTFETKDIQKCWAMARARHESGKWCLGGCGRKRKPQRDKLISLVYYKRARTMRESLNICKECMRERKFYGDFELKQSIVETAEKLKSYLERRNVTDSFLPILEEFVTSNIEDLGRIPHAQVGDVLIPRYHPYPNVEKPKPNLQIVGVEYSRDYAEYRSKRKVYIMQDNSRIESFSGKRYESCYAATREDEYMLLKE
jgi:hypothetical protein